MTTKDRSMIFERDKIHLGEKVSQAGISVRRWFCVSTSDLITIVVSGEKIAGTVLDRDETEELVKGLIEWLGEQQNEAEQSHSVYEGSDCCPGLGRID